MKQYLLIFLIISRMCGIWGGYSFAQQPMTMDIDQIIEKEYIFLEKLYKHLHSHPELSFEEANTSKRLADELRNAGFTVTENFGGYGIVGILKNGEGPKVLVRTDMDALPVKEKTGVPYASKVITKDKTGNEVSVMHACGHDVHMTVWTGTAKVLAALRDKWKGTLVFIGQPAEERGSGAAMMLKEGLFSKFPRPDYALALHVNPSLPSGRVGYCPGYSMANVDMMDITVYGVGGHGAYPQATIDPVVLASKIVLELQTIISREISPLDPAVITVGSIHGGTKHNIIPNKVKLELTLRSYTEEVRNQLIEKIKRTCNGIAMAAGLPEDQYPKVELRDEFTPSLYNNPVLTDRLVGVFNDALGEENIIKLSPVMGGEDFSRYGIVKPRIPLMMYSIGAVPLAKVEAAKKEGRNLPSLHSDKFIPDTEPTIKTGIRTMSVAVIDLLRR